MPLSFDFIVPVFLLHVACPIRDETKEIKAKKNKEKKIVLIHNNFHYNNNNK
jgi:hypothetical protein